VPVISMRIPQTQRIHGRAEIRDLIELHDPNAFLADQALDVKHPDRLDRAVGGRQLLSVPASRQNRQ
jgi:hypothetical protein